MNYKISRWIKRLVISFIILFVFISIVFFVSIAPQRTIPILMYHSISNKDNVLDCPESLDLSEDVFKRQMQYLSKHNYNIIPLQDLAQMIQENIDIKNNCIILTFDDGYSNFYSQAYPILKENKLRATLFISTDFLGKRKSMLSWKQVEKLAKDNLINIGSHGLSHRPLSLLDPEEAKKEIFLSKLKIEQRIEKSVVAFNYPYGAVDDVIKEMVRQAGYKVAVGTAYQRGQFQNDDVFVLKRVFVSKISKYPFVYKLMLSGYYVPTRELILKLLNCKVPRGLYSANKDK